VARIHWQAIKLWLKGVPFRGAHVAHLSPYRKRRNEQSEQFDDPERPGSPARDTRVVSSLLENLRGRPCSKCACRTVRARALRRWRARACRCMSMTRPCSAGCLARGDIGLAEAYIDGQWDSPDITGLLMLFAANRDVLRKAVYGSWGQLLLARIRHWMNRNSRAGSKRNIMAHYDLGNEFYAQWLDSTMSYSSAVYRQTDDGSLAAAQEAKYRRILEKLQASPDKACSKSAAAGAASPTWRCSKGLAADRPDAFAGAARMGEEARAGGRSALAGLPRYAGDLRPRGFHRDVRGRWRALVAELFQHDRRALKPGRQGGRSRASPSATTSSRRIAAVPTSSSSTSSRAACCRRAQAFRAAAAKSRAWSSVKSTPSDSTTRGRSPSGAPPSSPTGPRLPPWVSTNPSAACGECTSATARPASAPGTIDVVQFELAHSHARMVTHREHRQPTHRAGNSATGATVNRVRRSLVLAWSLFWPFATGDGGCGD
jgi:hypothetical protein